MKDEVLAAGLFCRMQERLYENACRASGVLPGAERSRPLVTAGESLLPATELVESYLSGTPFHEFFLTPIPFSIPERIRFEHTHIIGGAGWGKSTLITQTFLADIKKPSPPAIIIIDPHGQMLDAIQHLAAFDPAGEGSLSDRLIIIDPNDSAHPPTLNMFDAGTRLKTYSEDVRREIENNTISLYTYIFGSIASALTQKQSVAFSFVVRLLFSIPEATIHTLLELMEEDTALKGDSGSGLGRSRFAPFIAMQPPTARRFFEHHFYHPTEFRETRQLQNRLQYWL